VIISGRFCTGKNSQVLMDALSIASGKIAVFRSSARGKLDPDATCTLDIGTLSLGRP
jgi:hypothetical protein